MPSNHVKFIPVRSVICLESEPQNFRRFSVFTSHTKYKKSQKGTVANMNNIEESKTLRLQRHYEDVLSGDGDSSVEGDEDSSVDLYDPAEGEGHSKSLLNLSNHRSLVGRSRSNSGSWSSLGSEITLDSALDESFSTSSSGNAARLYLLSPSTQKRLSPNLECQLRFNNFLPIGEDELNSSDRFKPSEKRNSVTAYYSVSLPVRKPVRSRSSEKPHKSNSGPISSSSVLPKLPTRQPARRPSGNRRLRRGRNPNSPVDVSSSSMQDVLPPLMPRRCSESAKVLFR
jgi:hypothetical protein